MTACSRTAPISDIHNDTDELKFAILALSAQVESYEAEMISKLLISTALKLSEEYDMASPALYHNMLVRLGIRDRGLCCHWAEDIHAKLLENKVRSLRFDWLVARLGSQLREHNTVVIYSNRSTWEKGIVFDPWRKAGVPFWTTVKGDKYPWRLHPLSGKWHDLRCK